MTVGAFDFKNINIIERLKIGIKNFDSKAQWAETDEYIYYG